MLRLNKNKKILIYKSITIKSMNILNFKAHLIKNKVHRFYSNWWKIYIPNNLGKLVLNCRNHLGILKQDIKCISIDSKITYKGSLVAVITNIKNSELPMEFIGKHIINNSNVKDECTSGSKKLLYFPDKIYVNGIETPLNCKGNEILQKSSLKVYNKTNKVISEQQDIHNFKSEDAFFSVGNEIEVDKKNAFLYVNKAVADNQICMANGFPEAGVTLQLVDEHLLTDYALWTFS